MKNLAGIRIVCFGLLIAALSFPFAFGQSPVTPGGTSIKPERHADVRQPGGRLSDQIGVYRTIEGVRPAGPGKFETGTLLVDMVDGERLEKPIPLLVRGGVIVNHNLQEITLRLPADQHFVLKGFETGEMVGVPPAIMIAAREQGWTEVPMSSRGWHWRPYFVALMVVEPKGFELRRP